MNPTIQESRADRTRVDERAEHPPAAPSEAPPAAHAAPVPRRSIVGRLVRGLLTTVVVVGVAAFAMYKMHVDIPALGTAKLYAAIDTLVVRAGHWKAWGEGKYNAYFHKGGAAEGEGGGEGGAHHEGHKVLVTTPMAKDVVITQDYVCLIHSRRHSDIQAMVDGYLEAIPIGEGQSVKGGELLFSVLPVLYKARLAAETAERDLAQLELTNTTKLAAKGGVSDQEVKLFHARLQRAQAKMDQATAELNFASVRAPFDGIIDRLEKQQGSLVKEGESLTSISDNSVMWVYFNVTEKRYFEYMAGTVGGKLKLDVELELADQSKFPKVGKIDLANHIGAIEANFDNTTGNIKFRADFDNPDGLLRHNQTGKVLIHRTLKDALVIPQRATFENLAKRYVYVVDKDDVAHQREIVIAQVLDDIFVISGGLTAADRIIYEGTRQVRDGEKVEFEVRKPEDIMPNQKNHAE